MKEYPLLMSDDMIRALNADWKTQTRRPADVPADTTSIEWLVDIETEPRGRRYTGWVVQCGAPYWLPRSAPYGVPGDSVWMREAWTKFEATEHIPGGFGFRADLDDCGQVPMQYEFGVRGSPTLYRTPRRWRPSIHMPRSVCRIVREVVEVRAERVQSITPADAIAEGLRECTRGSVTLYGIADVDGFPRSTGQGHGWMWDHWEPDPVEAYRKLWQQTYGTWDENPWVWVGRFKGRDER